MEDTKLNEFDKIEWFDVCRRVRPELTWEDFEIMWNGYWHKKHEEVLQ